MMISELYKLYSNNYLVDTDTRNIRKNTIFFALKGANFNGNKFAEEALAKGAIYSVVDEEEYVTNENIILVSDVLVALQDLASYHRNQLAIPIIALTGSNGKTTTKELINVVLSQKYETTSTKGNLNNHIGVPLTLLSMTPKTEIGIVEMGANHHKEIAFLSKIASPDFGYITNFGKAHLEGFGSVEGVVEAKSELYDYLEENNKVVFVNPRDKIQIKKTDKLKRFLFDSTICFVDMNPFVKLSYEGVEIQSNLIGKYNVNNIAAAVTIGQYFNISAEKIKKAIESYEPNNNRSQVLKANTNEVILDAYNANPTSMSLAIENFDLINSENKILILGDMFELGRASELEHQKIVNKVSEYNFRNVFLVGEIFFKCSTSLTSCFQFKAFEDLQKYVRKTSIKDSCILIKGSRGMALERVLEDLI